MWGKKRQQGIDAANCLLAVSNTAKSTLILPAAVQTSSACTAVAVIQGYLSVLKDFFLPKIMACIMPNTAAGKKACGLTRGKLSLGKN